jgi:hypothetical protein
MISYKYIKGAFASLVLIGIFVFLTFVAPSYSQAESKSVDTKEYSGEVLKLENGKITIKTENEGSKELSLSDSQGSIQIKKNNLNAKIQDIKVNDKVTFTQSSDGKLLSLTVVSGSLSWLPLVLGVAAAFVVLGLIFVMLVKKKSIGHIKTSTEQLDN